MPFVSKRYLNMLEKELVYWRERADQERERADRLHDGLLTQCGQLPVTEVVRHESVERRAAAEEMFDQHKRELDEMFAEIVNPEELPDELKADAARMIEDGAAR